MEEKTDWLDTIWNDGVDVPWQLWEEECNDAQIWKQFDDHKGGWFDTDLSVQTPEEKGARLRGRLKDCTADQLNAMAELLYLAIKATRHICTS